MERRITLGHNAWAQKCNTHCREGQDSRSGAIVEWGSEYREHILSIDNVCDEGSGGSGGLRKGLRSGTEAQWELRTAEKGRVCKVDL